MSEANAIRTLDNLSPRREGKARLPFIRSRLQKAFGGTDRERLPPKPTPPKLANNPRNGNVERLTFIADGEKRLTTPSSATAERGAVAAWWGEVKAYELEKMVARRRRVRARNSSYRDTRSRSLQRMVRRYLLALADENGSGVVVRKSCAERRSRDKLPPVVRRGRKRAHRIGEDWRWELATHELQGSDAAARTVQARRLRKVTR